MIRTKYLVVSIFLCLLTIVGAGVFSMAPHTSSRGTSKATVIFATPQDSYQIEKYADTVKDTTRKDFIEKVRDSIAHDPVTTIQSAPVSVEEDEEKTISAPTPVVEPTPEPVQVAPIPVEPDVVAPTPVPEVVPVVTTIPPTDLETQADDVQGEDIPVI